MLTPRQVKAICKWLNSTPFGISRAEQIEAAKAITVLFDAPKNTPGCAETGELPPLPEESWLAFDQKTRSFIVFTALQAVLREDPEDVRRNNN